MARIRTVKPELFTDAKLCRITIPARFIAIGLLCHADREGRLVDDVDQLSLSILPRNPEIDFDAALQELEAIGYVIRYQAGALKLLQIRNFGKHQVCHVKEGASILPAPDMHSASTVPAPGGNAAGTCLANGKGKEGKGKKESSLRSDLSAIEFFERDPVMQVFAYWCQLWQKPSSTRLDAKRRKRIVDALRAYGIERTMLALRGYTYSPHHRGENDRGTVYSDLELHLRDARRIEDGCLLAERHDSGLDSGDMSSRERTEAATIAAVLRDA